MKTLRLILPDSLAVLLRLSARKTTSAHISGTIEESFHQQSSRLLDHPPDQQSAASDDETLTTTTTMSLPPDMLKPTSYLQSLFNLTLVEYSKQTGIDLMTNPFIATLDGLCSVDKAITVLRERPLPSSNLQVDDRVVPLMCQLESIFHIVSLLTPSEALCDNLDPVCQ